MPSLNFVMPGREPRPRRERVEHVFIEIGADPRPRLRAWALAILRLRASGSGWDTIAIMKKRVRNDPDFCDAMINGFRATPEETINQLRAALRSGHQPNRTRLDGWLHNWRTRPEAPKPDGKPKVIPEQPMVVPSASPPPDPAVTELESKLAELERNLNAERLKRLLAERARDDAHASLSDRGEELRTLRKQIKAPAPAPVLAAERKPEDIPASAPLTAGPGILATSGGQPAVAVTKKTHGIPKAAPRKPADIPAPPIPAPAPAAEGKPSGIPALRPIPVEMVSGQTLTQRRREAGFATQRAFAERLGCTSGLIAQWECGAGLPPVSRRAAIDALLTAGQPPLAERRKAAGLSLRQLAARVGISDTVLSRWELGHRSPSAKQQKAIDAALASPKGGPPPAPPKSKPVSAAPMPKPAPAAAVAEPVAAPKPTGMQGAWIVLQRTKLGMTRGELAKQLHVSSKLVEHWENDHIIPSATRMVDIREVLLEQPAQQPERSAKPLGRPAKQRPPGIGGWIYKRRIALDLSQEALAKLLGVTGALVSLWERQNRVPESRHAALVKHLKAPLPF
jgi:transcriptional regulator with XRE-family HTH domain